MTNDDAKPSFFTRYIDDPPPTEAANTHEKSRSIERLLKWLTNNWARDTITARDIITYGPYPLRNEKKAALDLAQGLVERGWLVELKPERHNMRKFKIGRNFQQP